MKFLLEADNSMELKIDTLLEDIGYHFSVVQRVSIRNVIERVLGGSFEAMATQESTFREEYSQHLKEEGILFEVNTILDFLEEIVFERKKFSNPTQILEQVVDPSTLTRLEKIELLEVVFLDMREAYIEQVYVHYGLGDMEMSAEEGVQVLAEIEVFVAESPVSVSLIHEYFDSGLNATAGALELKLGIKYREIIEKYATKHNHNYREYLQSPGKRMEEISDLDLFQRVIEMDCLAVICPEIRWSENIEERSSASRWAVQEASKIAKEFPRPDVYNDIRAWNNNLPPKIESVLGARLEQFLSARDEDLDKYRVSSRFRMLEVQDPAKFSNNLESAYFKVFARNFDLVSEEQITRSVITRLVHVFAYSYPEREALFLHFSGNYEVDVELLYEELVKAYEAEFNNQSLC